MGAFGRHDAAHYLLEQALDLERVLVLRPRVQDEADPLEALDAVLVLGGLAGEVAAGQAHLPQVLVEGLVVLVDAHHPVDNLRPVLQGGLVADEEVVLVEHPQDAAPQGLDEQHPRLVEEVVQHFRRALREGHHLLGLVLDGREQDLHPLAPPLHCEVHFLRQVGVLEDLQPHDLQGFERGYSVQFLQLVAVPDVHRDVEQPVRRVFLRRFLFVHFVEGWGDWQDHPIPVLVILVAVEAAG